MPLMLAAYFLSAVPVDRLANQRLPSPLLTDVADLVYLPVFLAEQHSSTVAAVLAWEHGVMDKMLGPMFHDVFWTTCIMPNTGFIGPFVQVEPETPADALKPVYETGE